jgi:GT2 family glycosyltransferase
MGYAVLRKSAFDRVGGYHPAMADGYEDWELCVNLVAHGYCGRAIPEPLYNYYVKPGARNSRAGRRHQELAGRIAARHETALRARWRILTSQARLSFQVENYLVNLVPAGNAPTASCWLFDCAQERVWFRPAGTLLKKLAAFARARPRDRVMVLLARPQLNLFLEAQPANLYFYSPREYHPNRKEAPFRRYLEARYRPRRLALRELEKL